MGCIPSATNDETRPDRADDQALSRQHQARLEGVLSKAIWLIAAGGFGLCGIPERLLDAIRGQRRDRSDLRQQTMPGSTMKASASCCAPRQVKKMNQLLCRREQGVSSGSISLGELEVEFCPRRHAGRTDAGRRRGNTPVSTPAPGSARKSPRASRTRTSPNRDGGNADLHPRTRHLC